LGIERTTESVLKLIPEMLVDSSIP
jgi:hypothetical protein